MTNSSSAATNYDISDAEIEGDNKEAGRKKETMRRRVMAAWEAWVQSSKNENSKVYADLTDVCQKFILNKVKKSCEQLCKAGTAQTPEDFAQDVIIRFLDRRHLYKSFDTSAKFYSYLNVAAFHTPIDAYRVVNKHKSRFVKTRVTVRNDAGKTEEVDNVLLHPEPTGFHGRMFHPPIPFSTMSENEKLVCAICADDPQERVIDGLLDKTIVHCGLEYYDIIPVRTYVDVAGQLEKWTGSPWNERKVRNIVHRLDKKGKTRRTAEQAEVWAYRAAWQAREQQKRDRLEAIVKALKAPALYISRAQCAEPDSIEDARLLGRQTMTDHGELRAA